MPKRIREALILVMLATPIMSLAAEGRPDSELVADCAGEVRDRFLDGVAADHVTVAVSEVRRGEAEDLVRIAVTSGEGRSVRATCKFRGGRLFDVLR